MNDNAEISEHLYQKDNKQQIHEELSQIIKNFDKINIKEIKSTIQDIHENIFEEDLNIVINDLVNLYFKEINEGKDYNVRKQNILNYINNLKINLNEVISWLLNNQDDSNSIYLLGYFNYNGIGMDTNIQKSFELYQKAVDLENNAAQCELAIMYENGDGIKKDMNQAIYWYKKSAKQGYEYAQSKLKFL
ncbi:hypothetical protein C1646_814180 [Rhizophagus diaphanus]|nr:hypothetical protein C1646_814180 [Rhizophagus diaphanus] [Rhizophagus sp. MUCL 43196]